MNFAVNLEPPRSRIIINESHTSKHLSNLIQNHPFNFELLVLLDQGLFQSSLENNAQSMLNNILTQKHSHYYVGSMCPIFLLSLLDELKDQQCAIYVHSIGSKTESANQIAIFPNNNVSDNEHTIYLRVNKDTYEQLGLEGSLVETFTHHNYHDKLYKSQYKIVIHYPINSKSILERVNWAFQKLSNCNVLCSVYRKEQNGEYKSLDMQTIFQNLNRKLNLKYVTNFSMINGYGSDVQISKHTLPVFRRGSDESSELVKEVLHTFGAISTEIPLDSIVSISGLECEEQKTRNMLLLSVTGFIPPHVVSDMSALLQNQQSHTNWSCILVRGVEDSVVSWKENAHGYGMSGENDYAIIFKENQIISCQILGQLDQL
jgi:hypothetical protein